MVAYFQEAIKLLMLKYWSYMYIQQFSNNIIDVPWYLQNLMYSFQIGKFTRFYEIGLLPNVFKENMHSGQCLLRLQALDTEPYDIFSKPSYNVIHSLNIGFAVHNPYVQNIP